MLYLEHIPAPPLPGFIRSLWYAQAHQITHRRERILPSGCVQIILNLARDYVLDCPEGQADIKRPPALVVGARSVYEIVDTSDMADLIGIVFEPGGFGLFAADAVDLFSNRTVDLEDLWGSSARTLRDRLRELPTPQLRLLFFQSFLAAHVAPRLTRHGPWPSAEVAFAIRSFTPQVVTPSVKEVARQLGWSERRLSQMFREEVGLAPKAWCRVQRFQRAVQHLHVGRDVRWAELALDCGYYDQSHFANEFRAFSGIDATTYSANRTQWANHIAMD